MTATRQKPATFPTPTIHQLTNGLTIVAEQMPVDAINFNLWLNVGSIAEPDSINGMAHFLEHMVFKGTATLQGGEFERLVEERGAMTNAATSQDYTHYYITTAPQDFAHLAPLQLDVVLNASLENEAFERERLVVLEEIRRSQDSPRRRTFQKAIELAFQHLPYRRQVLGPASVIEQLQPQQMKEFHHCWYQPPSMTAAVVGNLPVEQLIAIVEEGLKQVQPNSSSFFNTEKPQPHHLIPESPFTEIVRQDYQDQQLQQARLMMMWRVPGMNQLEETYALDVLSVILGQGKLSRLFRELREERRLVSKIGATNMTQRFQGVFYISATLPSENIPEVEKLITQHLHRLQTELVEATDINRIRKQVANRFIFSNEKPSSRANLYGYYYSQLGDLTPALEYPDKIQTLEASDLQQAAQRYLSPDAYGIVTVQPS